MAIDTRLTADGVNWAVVTAQTSVLKTTTNNVPGTTNTAAGFSSTTCYRVVVVVSAANASSIFDASSGGASGTNTFLTIPASTTQGTVYTLNWPCINGLSVTAGTGVTLAVSYA